MITFHSDLKLNVGLRDSLVCDLNYKVNVMILKLFGEEKSSVKGNNIFLIEYPSK